MRKLKLIFHYFVGVGDAFSKLLNRIIGGPVNESVSARAYRRHDGNLFWKFAYLTINALFFWQEDHCRYVFEKDQERNKAAIAQGVETCLRLS